MTFSSREEAGQLLGRHLAEHHAQPDIVAGLPRGGVIVAAEVARILQCPLVALIVRKIGHPRQREYAVGALAEHDVLLLDQTALKESRVDRGELDTVIAEETRRMLDYQRRFQAHEGELCGKIVLLVDDGLATGATTEAAVASARKQGADKVWVAAPVASPEALKRLRAVADDVMALTVEPDFVAVGAHYGFFPQTNDDEVAALLHTYN